MERKENQGWACSAELRGIDTPPQAEGATQKVQHQREAFVQWRWQAYRQKTTHALVRLPLSPKATQITQSARNQNKLLSRHGQMKQTLFEVCIYAAVLGKFRILLRALPLDAAQINPTTPAAANSLNHKCSNASPQLRQGF
eukprot:3576141-Amphidinium_carterae.1